jgi:hypothetical protein
MLKEKRKLEKEKSLNCRCANFKLSQQRGSPQQSVPHFVPSLHQNPSQLVALRQGGESLVTGRKINTIANHRIQYEIGSPG